MHTEKTKVANELAGELGIRPVDLTPIQRAALLDAAEYELFLRLLRSLKGNFVRARWRGVDISVKDL